MGGAAAGADHIGELAVGFINQALDHGAFLRGNLVGGAFAGKKKKKKGTRSVTCCYWDGRATNEIPPEERAMVQSLIDETYGQFTNVVRAGRGTPTR